jgi:hypothetical protein
VVVWTDNVLWLLEKVREEGVESLVQVRIQVGEWQALDFCKGREFPCQVKIYELFKRGTLL